MLLTTVALLAPLLLIGALGVVSARSRHFRQALNPLNEFVFRITLPCYLFTVIVKAPRPTGDVPWLVLLPGPLLAGASFVVIGLILLRRWPRGTMRHQQIGVVALCATWGNVAYLGVPIATGLAGPEAGLPAGIMQLLHNLLFLVGYPALRRLIGLGAHMGQSPQTGTSKGRTSPRHRIISVLTASFNPATLGVGTGVITQIMSIPVPDVILTTTTLLAGATVPCALFVAGLAVPGALHAVRQRTVPLFTVLTAAGIKTLLLPAIGALVLRLVAFTDSSTGSVWILSALIMLAVPSASAALNLAITYDHEPDAAASIIISTMLMFPLTLPIMLTLSTM